MKLNEFNISENRVSEEDAVLALVKWSKSLEVTPTVALLNIICTYLKDKIIIDNDIRTTIEHLIVMAIPKSRGVDLFKMYLIKDQLIESCQNNLKKDD